MSQYLTYSGFKLNSISENSLIGYILEVEYPSKLQELHNDCSRKA